MNSFLDSCVVINFLESDFEDIKIKKKCFDYINSPQRFLFCSYVLEEIKTVIRKREIQFNEILRKKKNEKYIFGTERETELLNKKELLFIEQLYEELKKSEFSVLNEKFESQIRRLRIGLDLFLKNKISGTLIKISEINKTILSIIHEFITEDYADCKVLTIAIQIQEDREQFLFVTADKHFDEGSYDFIENELRLKNYKKPKLKNLLFED